MLLKLVKLYLGFDSIEQSVEKKLVNLIVVASDTSEKTKKEMKFICDKFKIPFVVFGTIEGNSHFIGKQNRALIGICDEGLAKRFLELINEIK